MPKPAKPNTDLDALLGIPKEATGEEYLEGGIQALNTSAQWIARAGRSFQLAKEALPHGQFQRTLEARGVEARNAQRAIQVAEFLQSIPGHEAAKLVKAGYTKVLALAQASPEVIEDLVESGDLEGTPALSVRDLREMLKKRGQELARLEAKIDGLQAKNLREARLRNSLRTVEELPAFAAIMREESLALTEQASFAIENLESVFQAQLANGAKDSLDEFERFAPIAAGTCYQSVATIAARATRLLRTIEGQFGDAVAGTVTVEQRLSDAEIELLEKRREQLITPMQHALNKRAVNRENNKPGKRGRKRVAKP